jgi:hypothetical protein
MQAPPLSLTTTNLIATDSIFIPGSSRFILENAPKSLCTKPGCWQLLTAITPMQSVVAFDEALN